MSATDSLLCVISMYVLATRLLSRLMVAIASLIAARNAW